MSIATPQIPATHPSVKWTESDICRYWSKVRIGLKEECWTWHIPGHPQRYGTAFIGGKNHARHRVAWEIVNGHAPKGAFICHHCDNRKCMNPFHLYAGTHQDNMRDMAQRNRSKSGDEHHSRKRPETVARGDRHGARLHPECTPRGASHYAKRNPALILRGEGRWNTFLTGSQVTELRRLYALAPKSLKHIASQFGIKYKTAHSIVRRNTWKHVP